MPAELHLKKGARVALSVNLSDNLVNGLLGTVTQMAEQTVTVFFDQIDREVVLSRFRFSLYDVKAGKDNASRLQIPLSLAYAFTVHKAQGLTLDRVEVDCRNMVQSGQISVAIGRATSKRGLRVTHFDERLLKKPPPIILNFYKQTAVEPRNDLECCRSCMPCNSDMLNTVPDIEEMKHSFENGTDDELDDDDLIEAIETLESLALDRQNNQGVNDGGVCPTTRTPPDDEIIAHLKNSKYADVFTTQQEQFNKCLDF